MAYAILRTAKLTKIGNVAGSASHAFRERDTPNADARRTDLNRATGAASANAVVAAVKARLSTQAKIRKNAVLAIEYFVGMSPEFVDNGGNVEGYFSAAEKWLKDKHGEENLISFVRHYDETTPHVCAYVVPIDRSGKLNASYYLDGRSKLNEMQSDFAEKCGKPFNLERGIEGSRAKHKTIKQYYAEIEAVMQDEIEPATPAIRRVERAKAKQYDIEKKNNKSRAQALANLRETATMARDLPLESVLEKLGCNRDPSDKKNWRTPVGRITVTGTKFFAHDLNKGGGGAIDLVMLIEDVDYKNAVNRLARNFGSGAVLSEALATLKPAIESAAKAAPSVFNPPVPKPQNWWKVRKYLVESRCLSESLVDKLHEFGKVYADRYNNAVFVLSHGAGVEIRGTGEKPFHGVRGDKVPFTLLTSRDVKKVAFVESSIDAMSLHDLGFKGKIVATIGSADAQTRKRADAYRADGYTVIAAFDRDVAGERMSANLGQPTERMRPINKDWNDDLRAQRQFNSRVPEDDSDDYDYSIQEQHR